MAAPRPAAARMAPRAAGGSGRRARRRSGSGLRHRTFLSARPQLARPLPARLLLARLLLAALLLTGAAQARANAVSLGLWPTADPDAAVFCAVRLDSGRMTALEVQGLGRAPAPAVRWAARPQDVAALMAALAALVSGDLDGTDPTGSRFPAPPHASVTWMAQVDGRLDSGLYIQPGLELPPPLAALVAQVLPGGLCARALAAPAPAAP